MRTAVTYQSLLPASLSSTSVEVQPILGQRVRGPELYLPTTKAMVMLMPGIKHSGSLEDGLIASKSLYSPALTLPLPGPRENWSAMIA